MDFKLTGEQTLIKDSVERFVAQQPAPAEPWREFAKLGWLGIGAPEDVGGFGGALETMLVMEAFGRGLYLEPYAACAVFPAAILRVAAGHDLLESLIEASALRGRVRRARRALPILRPFQRAPTVRNDGYGLNGTKVRVPLPHRRQRRFWSQHVRRGESRCLPFPPRHQRSAANDDSQKTALPPRRWSSTHRRRMNRRASGPPAGRRSCCNVGLDHANAALCAEAVGLMSTMFDLTLGLP